MPPGLFDTPAENFAPGATLLRDFAAAEQHILIAEIGRIAAAAPFRNMTTPGGFTMSVAITSCGDYGWISDRSGYRYAPADPLSSSAWPPMPAAFRALARRAAAAAGYPDFDPDSCLINRYLPGARMSLHQDRQEKPLDAPVVSISLGLPAMFLWGGDKRTIRPLRFELRHADAVVWGGISRLNFHGVAPLKPGEHPLLGQRRINMTFRRVE